MAPARSLYPGQVAKRILAQVVEGGGLRPGERLPSVRELTKRLGVSTTSVVNGLSILQAQGIVRKVHGVGCFVAGGAATPGEESHDTLAFIMPNVMSTGCLTRVYAGVERAARARGYDLVTATAHYDYAVEQSLVDRFVAGGCKGIVMNPVTRTRPQLRSDYLNRVHPRFPIVLIDIAQPEQRRSQVLFDNFQAGLEMTRLLIEKGHRRIAFMDAALPSGESPMHTSTAERYRGYLQAHREAGIAVREQDHWRASLLIDDHETEAEEVLRQWVDQRDRPTAVIALTDDVALDLIHAAQASGVNLPGTLQVAGFDNSRPARSLRPSFPTTDPDFELAGETAVELLCRHINGERRDPLTYVLPVPLIRTDIPERVATDVRPRAVGGARERR